jgi:hypothetical protein
MKQERTYVAWLAGSIVGGLALVGSAAAADVQKGVVARTKPGIAVASADSAPKCDVKVSDGSIVRGNLYDGLCLTSPPTGYLVPMDGNEGNQGNEASTSDTASALRTRRPAARFMSMRTMSLDPRPCVAAPAQNLEQV